MKLLIAFSFLFLWNNNVFSQVQKMDSCKTISLPVVRFRKNSVQLDKAGKAALDSIVSIFNENNGICKLWVIGRNASSEAAQQISWDKAWTVTQYLISKGIDSNRIIFKYCCEDGEINTVNVVTSLPGEDGPSMLPQPHPCVSHHLPKSKRCKQLH